jgi:hypothetical protein
MSPPWADELVALYQDRYAPMVRLAYLWCRDPAVAEELVQDAFVADGTVTLAIPEGARAVLHAELVTDDGRLQIYVCSVH